MGSTFGKARKYSLHSMETSTLKYQTEDEIKPSLPADKGIFLNHQPDSLRSRVEKTNSKMKSSYEGVSMFNSGYTNNLMPEYYNVSVNEELLTPQKIQKSSSNSVCEEGDYITLMETVPKPPTPPPLPDDNIPPPLPPRNKLKIKTINTLNNTALNSNPRPNQKVYSAEDINRLLRPLNEQNSNSMRSISSFEQVTPERYQHHLRHHGRYYRCPHICDCQRYNTARIYHDFSSPPPYHYAESHETVQNMFQYPHQLQDSFEYKNANIPHYHTMENQQGSSSAVHPHYNTMYVDRDIHNHHFRGNRPRPGAAIIDKSKYDYNSGIHRRTNPQDSHNSIGPQTRKNSSTFKEEKGHVLRHKRDSLYQSEVFSQSDLKSDPTGYRSLRLPPCYTIPEEGSWLPPFHYEPTMFQGRRRSYHH